MMVKADTPNREVGFADWFAAVTDDAAGWLRSGAERFGGQRMARGFLTPWRDEPRVHFAAPPVRAVYWSDDTIGRPAYVGATRGRVADRLRQHVSGRSRFGLYLERNPDAVVRFVAVPFDVRLFDVERRIIRLMRPAHNVA
jgi:hypothetical protein